MEKYNHDCIAGDSPQESAIRFLLRHAECQRVLAISAWGEPSPLAIAVPERDPNNTAQPTASVRSLVAAAALAVAVVASPMTSESVAANESFRSRFSPAYAAARHLPPPKRALSPGLRRTVGSSPRLEGTCGVVAA